MSETMMDYKKYHYEPEPATISINLLPVRSKKVELILLSYMKNPIELYKIRIMVIFVYAALVATIVLIELFLCYRDLKH